MAETAVNSSAETEMQNLNKRYKVPVGLKCLLEELSREVLRAQPADIHGFLADYLEDKCRKMCAGEGTVGVGGAGMGGTGSGGPKLLLQLDTSIYLVLYSRHVCADGMEARSMAGPQGENAFGTDAMTGTNALPRGDNGGRPQSAPGGFGPNGELVPNGDPNAPFGLDAIGRPIAPYGLDADGRPLTSPNTAAPYGVGPDGQPIEGPNPNAPFGYGPDGKPLTALDPRAPNGYGPDGKPLPGLACTAPYGLGRDRKPLQTPDPSAPFGYHPSDGLPVATNDPLAPFGYGPDGNPLPARDQNAPYGYTEDGRPNSRPERVAFCDADVEAIQAGFYDVAQSNNVQGRAMTPTLPGSVTMQTTGAGEGLTDVVDRIELRDEQVGGNWPLYADGSGGVPVGPDGNPVMLPNGAPGMIPNGPPGPGMFQNGPPVPGMYQYGPPGPGMYQNGPPDPGMYQNGPPGPVMYQNGPPGPGMYQNSPPGPGMFQNGPPPPGMFQNGPPGPGMLQNGPIPPGMFQNGPPGPGMYPNNAPGMPQNGMPPGNVQNQAMLPVGAMPPAYQNGPPGFTGGVEDSSQTGGSLNDPTSGLANCGNMQNGSVLFVGGPNGNMILTYDPARVLPNQAPIAHMANAANCGMNLGGSVGMVDCATTMRAAMECMLTRVTTILGGVLMQNLCSGAPPAAGNRIGLTDYITDPSFSAAGTQATGAGDDPRGFTYPVTGEQDGGQGPDTVGEDGEPTASRPASQTSRPMTPQETTGSRAASRPVSATDTAVGGDGAEAVTGTKPTNSAVALPEEPQSATNVAASSKPPSTSKTNLTTASGTVLSQQGTNPTASTVQAAGSTTSQRSTGSAKSGVPTSPLVTASATSQRSAGSARNGVPTSPMATASATTQRSAGSARTGAPTSPMATASATSQRSAGSARSGAPTSLMATASATSRSGQPKVRRRCIPDELKQFVPGAGPGVCAAITGQGVSAAPGASASGGATPSCPPIPPRRMRLENLLVTKDSKQLKMGEYIGDILNRATDRILQSRKEGEAIPPALLREKYCEDGRAGGAASAPGAPNSSQLSSLHEPPIVCTSGTLGDALGGKSVGSYLKEMAPQYKTVLDSVLSPDDQTTLTLLTTVGTLLDTIEDTGLTRMDPVQLCSDNTLKSLVDVGEKMMIGLREHLTKIKSKPPESNDPFMSSITQEAQDALEIGAESLEVAVGLLKDVVNLCGEMAEHPELLEKCEADIAEARTRTEKQMEHIKTHEMQTCSKDGSDGTESSEIVCGASDGEPCDESSATAAQEMRDAGEGDEGAGLVDTAAEADGNETGAVGAAGISDGTTSAGSKSKAVSATKVAASKDALTGAAGAGPYATPSGNLVTKTPSGNVIPVTRTPSGKLVAKTASGKMVPVPEGQELVRSPSGRIVGASAGKTASGRELAKTRSGRMVAKTASGKLAPVGEGALARSVNKGIFAGISESVGTSSDGTFATVSRGRIVLFSVSFVVGVVVGYVLARSLGLFGLGCDNNNSGGGRLSGLFWGPTDRAVATCSRPAALTCGSNVPSPGSCKASGPLEIPKPKCG